MGALGLINQIRYDSNAEQFQKNFKKKNNLDMVLWKCLNSLCYFLVAVLWDLSFISIANLTGACKIQSLKIL